jgi:serine/threonine-protein kinase RsbT
VAALIGVVPAHHGLQPYTVQVSSTADVERTRRATRRLAISVGFGAEDAEAVVLAASELATNLVRYAPGGELLVSIVSEGAGTGIALESRDTGPGIADVALALRDGYSTGGGLGSGLPAVRRLMDDFSLTTGPTGTRIEARKWLNDPSPSR